MEYYRQGLSVEFEFILKEIVDAIAISCKLFGFVYVYLYCVAYVRICINFQCV